MCVRFYVCGEYILCVHTCNWVNKFMDRTQHTCGILMCIDYNVCAAEINDIMSVMQ